MNKKRKVTESTKKLVAGNQWFKCANKPDSKLKRLEDYECPLWCKVTDNRGCFDGTGYEIDHIDEVSVSGDNDLCNLQALCKMCHCMKTKMFMREHMKSKHIEHKQSAETDSKGKNETDDMNETDDENESDDKKNKISKNKICQDQMNKRALYSKESSLTACEVKIMENAKKRAEFLNINFIKKVEKKRWEPFLVDGRVFSQYCAFRLLSHTDDKLDANTVEQLEKDYDVLNYKCLLAKIKLIKQLEGILQITMLNIDTRLDVNRFEEDVTIHNDLKNTINRVFRVTNKRTEKIGKYSYWYYQLIQMYKNVVGNDFFNSEHATRNRMRYMIYKIVIPTKHELLKQRNP